MQYPKIMDALDKLGSYLKNWLSEYHLKSFSNPENYSFQQLIKQQHAINNWHNETDIATMLKHLSHTLNTSDVKLWCDKYPQIINIRNIGQPVLLKPNVNYSFSAFHEWLCCIVTQTPFVLNADINQYQVLRFLSKKLVDFDPAMAELFHISQTAQIKPHSYIIHTEKKNAALSAYFGKKKALVIEPYHSIGIITGEETPEQLAEFGRDVFMHLGQSSRTLRKLFLPLNFDVKQIIASFEPYLPVYQNNKYANNYDYHQSVFLMNRIPFLDNGFLIFKEDQSNEAPTGCLYYEYYQDIDELLFQLKTDPYIENIISIGEWSIPTKKPGTSHFFNLHDYLNNKDIIQFLLE
jgi:hypothetical protein